MMKVFAVKLETDGVKREEISHELGIRIQHNNKEYTIAEDNQGHLILRSIDCVQLLLMPEAGNTVRIDSSHD